jgi:outer membrane translocation and assembly module TamA
MRNVGFIFCLLFFQTSYATEPDTTRTRNLKVYPLPAIGYAPETRWYFGAVALFSLQLSNLPETKKSTIETEFNYTQNKQIITTLNFEFRTGKNKWLLTGENGFYDFPEYYWGFGINTTESDKVFYEATRIEIDNSALRKLKFGPYLGLRYRYHYMDITQAESPAIDNTKISESGIGLRFVIDTRDNVLNATTGCSFSFSPMFFSKIIGGDTNFQRYSFDFRYYKTVHKKGVVATQVVIENTVHEAPFRLVPLLGSESIMRGYYQGRYRDKNLVAAQIEYRATVWNWIGATVFGGAGTVYEQLKNETLKFRPTYGAGLRIRMDKKDNINLRFDYAKGYKTDGFYVSFGEAF